MNNFRFLSDLTVYLKYAKNIGAKRECWKEIVDRSRRMHLLKFPEFNTEIVNAFKLVDQYKILPSMRSIQFGGQEIEMENVKMYNCAYCPIIDLDCFKQVLFLLLNGTGVGFSVQKHHIAQLPPKRLGESRIQTIILKDDVKSICDGLDFLIKSFFGECQVEFDLDQVQDQELVKTWQELVQDVKQVLKHDVSTVNVYDLVCFLAKFALTNKSKRSALIALFSCDDDKMMSAKSGDWWKNNVQRSFANNSIVFKRGLKKEFFEGCWHETSKHKSGEPGIFWTNDVEVGTNPCAEISLEPFQFCNLVDVNVATVSSRQDFNQRVKAASLIATLQASYTKFDYLGERWKRTTERDALIGIGLTGIASLSTRLNFYEAAHLAVDANKYWASKIGINSSARCTTIKPSGTSSLVLGVSSGIHAFHDQYYLRRIRIDKSEMELIKYLSKFNLIENDLVFDKYIATIPIKTPPNSILRTESSIDMLERIKYFYSNWIIPGHVRGANRNNISATVSVKDHEWRQVGEWMWNNRDYYNALSILPFQDYSYVQAPFESIDEAEFFELPQIDLSNVKSKSVDRSIYFECSGGSCEVF